MCTLILFPFRLLLNVAYDGFLSFVLVRVARIDLEAGDSLVSYGVIRQHTLYGVLHCELGLCCHESLVVDLLESADVTGMVIVFLLLKLSARSDSLGSVDYYYEFAAVHMRCELGSVFTAKNVGSERSGLAERLAGSVDNIPLAVDSLFFCHEC